jgi:NagD protein
LSRSLLDFSAYVFDLDGTVYLGPHLIEGVGPMLARLRESGKSVRFLSNNPLQTRANYAAKLRLLGVEACDNEVMNSSAVTTLYLKEHHPGKRLYVIGEAPLIGELIEAGFPVVAQSSQCDLVLLSFDRNFHYVKLHQAMLAARRGVPLIATNPDVACPVPGGVIPDCGAVIAAVEACSGRKVDVIVGKPSEIMLEVVLGDLGLPPEEVLLVGDRLETDMEMGRRAGMNTALVLSGVSSEEAARAWPHPPTYILNSAAEITRGDCHPTA